MDKIEGQYHFTVIKKEGCYIAVGIEPSGLGKMITQGKSVPELFDNISDAYLTIIGVQFPWHVRVLYKLIRLLS
jgi:predicted RNase H-like HicB family nuclease